MTDVLIRVAQAGIVRLERGLREGAPWAGYILCKWTPEYAAAQKRRGSDA